MSDIFLKFWEEMRIILNLIKYLSYCFQKACSWFWTSGLLFLDLAWNPILWFKGTHQWMSIFKKWKLSSILPYRKLNPLEDKWFALGHKANYLKSLGFLFGWGDASSDSSSEYLLYNVVRSMQVTCSLSLRGLQSNLGDKILEQELVF